MGRFDFVHALRALANLVENALRHSPDGQWVELDVSEEDGEIVFRVMDRGPGVPDAERERIFEPFFRDLGPCGPRGHRPGPRHRPERGGSAGRLGALPAPPRRGQRLRAPAAGGRFNVSI